MKNALNTPVADGITRREGLLTLLGSALALAGCGGGGGGVAGVSSGGTGSFSAGPITGFGSIIVNGIRFEDQSASIVDDDGAPMDRSRLKLGMLTTVKGSKTTTTGASTTATATSIVVGGELQGPISSISAATANPRTLVILGQTVEITGSTIFDTSIPGGFQSLAVGDILEVHGVLDPAANRMQATFIEKKNAPNIFKIQGIASGHNATTKTFAIGSIQISYLTTPADEVRITPADGTLVRVRVQAQTPAPAVWTATRIRPPENANEDRDEADVEGIITARGASFTSFSVAGIPVDASGANVRFDDGTAGIVLGARVRVKGRLSGGVLIAERVRIEDNNEVNNLEFELHGTVSNLTPTTFTLTSSGGLAIEVTYSGPVAGLSNGSRIEVKGTASDPTNASTRIVATRISFE
ncbi:DUF5666 domain-containing protein [Polaromonas sp. P1-6]|nr:DUF5666 domain-containing protein [Polaromonas sp. P1-6]